MTTRWQKQSWAIRVHLVEANYAATGLAAAKKPVSAATPEPTAGGIVLPEAFREFHAAAGGKTLVFLLPDARQLAVYDAVSGTQQGTIPFGVDDATFACGSDCIILALPSQQRILRYDLKTLVETRTGKLDVESPMQIRMGNNSQGPVYIGNRGEIGALDGTTLEPISIRGELPHFKDFKRLDFRVSADGTALTTWPGKFVLTHINGGIATRAESSGGFGSMNRKFFPTADGSFALYEDKVFGSDAEPIGKASDGGKLKNWNAVPTSDPRFYFRIDSSNKKKTSAEVFASATRTPLAEVKGLPDLGNWRGSDVAIVGVVHDSPNPGEPRLIYLPQDNLLISVPVDNREFVQTKFVLDEVIAGNAVGSPPLAVISIPPRIVQAGGTLSYQVQALPSKATLSYKIESGPDGMQISSAGLATWKPSNNAAAHVKVVLEIADQSNHVVDQTFELQVQGAAPPPAAVASAIPPPVSPATPPPPTGPAGGGTVAQDNAKPHKTASTPGGKKPEDDSDKEDASAAAGNVVVKLGERFHEFHAADGGRSLVFYEKAANAIVVYDTATGVQRGSIPLAGEAPLFACGSDCIIVCSPATGSLARYDLKSLQKSASASLSGIHDPKIMHMGSASSGPVYFLADGAIMAMDAKTLSPMKLRGDLPMYGHDAKVDFHVSADGGTLVSWDTSASPGGFEITQIKNGLVSVNSSVEGFSMVNRRFNPSADGSLIFYEMQFFSPDGVRVGTEKKSVNGKDYNDVPDADPRFFFKVDNSTKHGSPVSLCTTWNRRELVKLTNVPNIGGYDNFDWGRCGTVFDSPDPGEPRIIYLPDEKILAAINRSDDRFTLMKLDLAGTMTAESAPAVVSLPPGPVAIGESYSYQVQVLPDKGAFTFKLKDAPAGMEVSPAGLVTWKPSARPIGGKVSVNLSINDASGHETVHAFDIQVVRPLPGGSSSDSGGIVKADDHDIELPVRSYCLVPGLNNHLLLLAGNQLAILGPDGFTITSTHTLPKNYLSIGERGGYYVAISGQPQSVDILDKQTFQVLRNRSVNMGKWGTMALNPTHPYTYISYLQKGDRRYRFMVFDETTTDARTDDSFEGQWLAVTPDGKRVVAGVQSTYQSDTHILDTGDRLDFIPVYSSLDELHTYTVMTDNAVPIFAEEKDKIGEYGTGLCMSPDGQRVTYFSKGGSPRGSGCLCAWDPSDLSRVPVNYDTKGLTVTNIAFHPTLPQAVCCGKGVIAFFNRETGAKQDVDDVDLAGENLGQAYFAPDGKSLLVQRTVGPIVYPYRMDMKQ
jgi:hypothetical protein